MITKQSTVRTIMVGPILDTDGVAKTDEVVASIKIAKNGTVGALDGSATLTHDHTGNYKLALTANDLATVGFVEFSLNSGTNIMSIVRLEVVPANVYDSIVAGTDSLEVDTIAISGVTASADELIAKIDRNMDITESQRGDHTVQGGVFYVAPVNGVDAASRGTRLLPLATVQYAHDNYVTDSEHDCIILISDAAAGVTTLTDDVTLTKRYLQIRGPGRDFIWTRTGNGNTITITGDGIGLSGFQLETAGTGVGHGVDATAADFLLFKEIWFNDTRGDGIHLLRCTRAEINDCVFFETGQSGAGDGVDIVGTAGASSHVEIKGCTFLECAGDAITTSGGAIVNTIIENNIIHGSTGWGINLSSGSEHAQIFDNVFSDNASGNINDVPADSQIQNNEQWQKSGPVEILSTGAVLGGEAADDLVDGVWDEVLTGATHNVANSSGRLIRQLGDIVVHEGTAQGAGVNGNQIVLDTGASSDDRTYDPGLVILVSGTGEGQMRRILEYEGSTRTATVNRTWAVNPDATSGFIIYADAGGGTTNEGLAQAGTTDTITLNALASSDDNAYVGQFVKIVSGLGDDQARIVSAYDGTTKIAAVVGAWDTIPDTTSAYEMRSEGLSCVKLVSTASLTQISDAIWTATTRTLTSFAGVAASIWDYLTSSITTVGSIGLLLKTNIDAKISSVGGVPEPVATVTEATLDVDSNALGAVQTDEGVPIAGAFVSIYADADTGLSTVLYQGVSDGDGGYSISVAAGATYRFKTTFTAFTFDTKRFTV